MGSQKWDSFPNRPTLEVGHFYRHPVNGVIRLLTGNQYDHGRRESTGYYKWEIVATGEQHTGIPGPLTEVDAEQHRHWLIRRLDDHRIACAASVPAIRLSLILLTLDGEDAVEKYQRDVQRAAEEMKIRRERYSAPLDQDLPAVTLP